MAELRVGIAGYGVVGRRRREVVDSDPRLRLVAVCDRTFLEDGEFDDGVVFRTDYRRLIDESLDLLLVCMTNDMAAEVSAAV